MSSEIRKRQKQGYLAKYPWILARLSLDTLPSILGYFLGAVFCQREGKNVSLNLKQALFGHKATCIARERLVLANDTVAWEEDVQRIGCYDSGYFPHRGAGSQALGNGAVGDGMAVLDVLQHLP